MIRITRVIPASIHVTATSGDQTQVNLTTDVKAAALVGIREVLTEDNTDALIARIEALVKPRLPWYARLLPIGAVLDRLLPDVLLRVFEELLGA